MPEMPNPCEHHRQTFRIGCSDNLVIAHRSARLDNCRRSRFRGSQQPVGKRKKRIRCDD
jgi:hypothetical protein